MKEYIKTYIDYYGYTEADLIPCQICLYQHESFVTAVDIHHIDYRGMGSRAGKDGIENLIALCRKCHEECHKSIYKKEYLSGINNIKRSTKSKSQ